VIPTFIQENGPKTIEAKIEEFARLPDVQLSENDKKFISDLGNNKGCMSLKGGNPAHEGEPMPDRWPLSPELAEVGRRWGIDPARDLACTHG
jgi:hypothetical protein